MKRATTTLELSKVTESESTEKGSDAPGTTAEISLSEPSMKRRAKHPKGHNVTRLEEIVEALGSEAKPYVPLSNERNMKDVLFQPIQVFPIEKNRSMLNVEMHIFVRGTSTHPLIAQRRMSSDDLLKVLYLGHVAYCALKSCDQMNFNDWINRMSGLCVEKHGRDKAGDNTVLCNYILREDPDYTFYPNPYGNITMFFQKSLRNSYPTTGEVCKYKDPFVVKCESGRGFEWMYVVSLVPYTKAWLEEVSKRQEEQLV